MQEPEQQIWGTVKLFLCVLCTGLPLPQDNNDSPLRSSFSLLCFSYDIICFISAPRSTGNILEMVISVFS